ncbi:MAG TPA: flagellar basal body-associated FliL family protein [Bacteriovoracaceae bacterium]|nr:flagellar basal body-associated FliL family protein [Bacteriovoracaceae bacterium]
MFSLNNILGMLSVAATAATLGFFIYLNSFYERPTPSNESELEALKNDTAKVVVTETFQVKKLVINLNSPPERLRYLDLTAQLVPFKVETIPIIEKNAAFIRDTIIKTAGAMAPDELNTISGKILLEDRIKRTVNNKLQINLIKKILFTDFVIQ